MVDFLLDPTTLMLLSAALIAGIIDSIAGGGGLITVPALYLCLGGSPVAALGTNKLQSLFGSLSATIAYARAGHINLKAQGVDATLSFIGGLLGALLATKLPKEIIVTFLPILLISVALYFALKPNIGDIDRTRRMGTFLFTMTIPPLIGFYDGVFGPGTGSFFMLAFVSLAGFGMLKATAHTKLLNFSSNIGGFLAFAVVGAINWKIGLLMGAAQFIGAQIGVKITIKIGTKLIKPLLVIICTILAIKLMLEPQNPLHQFIIKLFYS